MVKATMLVHPELGVVSDLQIIFLLTTRVPYVLIVFSLSIFFLSKDGFNFFDHSSVNYMAKMDVCAHGDSDSYWSENFEMVEISCPWYNPYC